jgi:hypothetical protein
MISRATYIQTYNEIAANGGQLIDLAEKLGLTMDEVYSRNTYYRQQGDQLSPMRRYSKRGYGVTDKEFITAYRMIERNGGDYSDLARLTQMSKNSIKCRVYSLRKRGVVLGSVDRWDKNKKAHRIK